MTGDRIGPMPAPRGAARVTIRPAEAGDAAAIAELSGQLGYPTTAPATAARLEAIGGLTDHRVSVAVLPDGGVIGWIHAYVRHLVMLDRMIEIDGLVVDERHRWTGVGRALMAHVESWAAERSCRSVRLRSNVTRGGAHDFYRRLGYELVKRQAVFRKEIR